MPTKKERVVPKKERSGARRRGELDWEGARIFLEVARAGSFRAAANSLGQSVNALRRGLDKLESDLGTTLLTRHINGVKLTPEGERIFAPAQRMEAAAFELVRGRSIEQSALTGEIRLAATEGLGTFWVAPRLAGYRRLHPRLSVNLHCTMSIVDVLQLEADIAIQLKRPSAKDLKIVKLARLHSMPFASKAYVAAHGIPKSAAELSKHQLVMQIAEQVTPPENTPPQVQAALRNGGAIMRTNSSSSHYHAVLSGVGIGMLGTYCKVVGEVLVPIDINYRTHHDIWLVYHRDAGRNARVHTLIEWLIDIFSQRKYPWFADKFIHPNDLPSTIEEPMILKG